MEHNHTGLVQIMFLSKWMPAVNLPWCIVEDFDSLASRVRAPKPEPHPFQKVRTFFYAETGSNQGEFVVSGIEAKKKGTVETHDPFPQT